MLTLGYLHQVLVILFVFYCLSLGIALGDAAAAGPSCVVATVEKGAHFVFSGSLVDGVANDIDIDCAAPLAHRARRSILLLLEGRLLPVRWRCPKGLDANAEVADVFLVLAKSFIHLGCTLGILVNDGIMFIKNV